MFSSPSGQVRPLPQMPGQPSNEFEPPHIHLDAPPILPPIGSFNDEPIAPQADDPPPSGSVNAVATPPQSPGFQQAGGKNRNPLIDLIDSEEQFVALMSAIIRV
jgi:hypothetical protein